MILLGTDAKVSKKIYVSIRDTEEEKEKETFRTPAIGREHRQPYEWKFRDTCNLHLKEVMLVSPLYSRTFLKKWSSRKRPSVDEFEITFEELVEFCRQRSSSNNESVEYEKRGGNCTLRLVVTLHKSTSVQIENSMSNTVENDDSQKQTDGLDSSAVDASSLSDDVISALRRAFASISDNVDTIQVLEPVVDLLRSFAATHPIINTVVQALLIPYEVWKNRQEFVEDMRLLVTDMCIAFKSVVDASPEMRLESAKDSIARLLKVIIDASRYVKDFQNKGKAEQYAVAQFRHKLDEFRSSLKICRINFRETALVQVVANTGALIQRDNLSLLRDRLKPVEEMSIDGGCMKGTRKTVLSEVKAWLDSDADHNVLWLRGAPGTGKTAVASSIIEDILHYNCAKFFIKRGQTALMNPRNIWRTIAFQFASMHGGVRADINAFLSGRDAAAYPDNARVDDQFRRLMLDPIKKRFGYTPVSPLIHGIVVVVDGLDECALDSPRSRKDWLEFLRTIDQWNSEMPRPCRLIVTSRADADIEKQLDIISHPLVLDAGHILTDESRDDIKFFFEQKFKTMEVGDSWPGVEVIAQLTQYAAGLFVWATTVVNFVEEPYGDKKRRLKEVLKNMAKVSDADYMGQLYMQILFASSPIRNSEGIPTERNSMSLVLASMALLKKPLPKKELLRLLAPDDELSSRSIYSIEASINRLRSVIVNDGQESQVQAFHKSFSDFLLDEERVETSLSTYLDATSQHPHRVHTSKTNPNSVFQSFLRIFSHSRQSALLAEGCLWLMNHSLKFNICGIPSSHYSNNTIPNIEALVEANIPSSLEYACSHWAEHLADADRYDFAKRSRDIQDRLPPLIITLLQEHTLHWLEVMSLAVLRLRDGELDSAESRLQYSFMFAADYMQDSHSETSSLGRDASKFLEAFSPVISLSAPHIYISALPFSPQNSLITTLFGPKFKNTLSLVQGRRNHWSSFLHMARIDTCTLSDIDDFFVCGAHAIVPVSARRTISPSADPLRSRLEFFDAYRCRDEPAGPEPIRFMAVSENGTMMVFGRDDSEKVELWDWAKEEPTRTRLDFYGIVAATFVLDDTLVLGSRDGEVIIIDVLLRVRRKPQRHSSSSRSYDAVLMLGSSDILRTGVEGHEDAVNSLACSPNDHLVVSCSLDGSLIIWDTINADKICRLHGHDGAVRSVAWSSNGHYIVSGSDDCTVRIWSMNPDGNGTLLKTIPSQCGEVTSVKFCFNNVIVSGSREGVIRIWSRESCKAIGEPIIRKSAGAINNLAFSWDRTRIAAVYDDSYVCVWDARTPCGIGNKSESYSEQHTHNSSSSDSGRVMSMDFDSDGKRIASGSTAGDVCIWDASSGARLAFWKLNDGPIFSVQFSRGRNCVFAASVAGKLYTLFPESQPDTVVISISEALRWPVAICPESKDMHIHIASPTTVRVSPPPSSFAESNDRLFLLKSFGLILDGDQASTSNASTKSYNNKLVKFKAGETEESQLVDSQFHHSTTSSNNQLEKFKASDAKELQLVDSQFHHITKSSNTSESGSLDKFNNGLQSKGLVNITLWRIDKGRCMRMGQLEGHESRVTAIAFSSDNNKIISASDDRTIRLWDVEIDVEIPQISNKAYRVLDYHANCSGVFSLTLSPTSEQFAMGTMTRTRCAKYEVWDTDGTSPSFTTYATSSSTDSLHFGVLNQLHENSSQSWLIFSQFPQCAEFSPDGKVFAWSAQNGVVEMREADKHWCLGVKSHIALMRFSLDGKRLATGPGRLDDAVRIWATGRVGRRLLEPARRATLEAHELGGGITPAFTDDPEIFLDVGFGTDHETARMFYSDGKGVPVIGDWSYIDSLPVADSPASTNGFVRNRMGGRQRSIHDANLFWLPPENRDRFWWPRNTAILDEHPTRIDFSRFMHGKDWHLCRTPSGEIK
ncbi:WD40 repeat-like protein [Schizopora paradoxa]|uniref:WD40 repeat-like protein n=1 Tax=Schizopora paradoxa TaxID=27342 RepID=A0A0H2S6W8_9AGAM|nr:WD40 repeat-like protein [Schizopora paradoxa]